MYTGKPQEQPPQGQQQPPMPPQEPSPAQEYGQQPYYVPPKKSNLVLILVLVGVFVFIPVVGGIVITAISVSEDVDNNARDARRVEAESMSRVIIRLLRADYAETKFIPRDTDPKVISILRSSAGLYVAAVAYKGTVTRVSSGFTTIGTGKLTFTMKDPTDGQYIVIFDYSTGDITSKTWTGLP
ncbi:MAG: hypothetical protein L3J82_02170 [Planctomycetes bacterium]|nr:hypothetical protein [Planctomycetota bacterium]